MFSLFPSDERLLQAARKIVEQLAAVLDARFSVRLWDGSMLPLGSQVDTPFYVAIAGPGVIGTILRRPTLETLLKLYATGQIALEGGDLLAFGELARLKRSSEWLPKISKLALLREALPFLTARSQPAEIDQHQYDSDEVGRREAARRNKNFIQFHYDVSNEFYSLFLDPEMQYSCGYFTDWNNSLEQAQFDKLDMICRKLRLEPGEKMLDVGCGWGGLLCHAATHYGVRGHGVTLSQKQHDFAQAKIRRLGLADRITIELRDYSTLEGKYDKISSIGMFEHIGLANFPRYFRKLNSLLRDRGILLNHGIARRAKSDARKARKIRPERRLLLKYIFPGSELAPIGDTTSAMEACGFELHDVEAWREHYALTCRHWSQRLTARREEAIKLVGAERYHLWAIYLAGASLGFAAGSIRIFQAVGTKHASKGPSGLPPTRSHLYLPRPAAQAAA